jgi:hypothetical protein
MDSGRIEDLLQQYLTQMLNLQGEPRTRHEQQDQNGTNEHGTSITDSSVPAETSREAVRLPPFWVERPAVWFAQAEAQFTLAGISNEQTKFYYEIAQLDHRYTAEVEDIIISPPERAPYTKLKTKLVRLLSPSKEHRIRKLLTLEDMGDHKPAQFLRHLRSLVPDMKDNLLRSFWSNQLPSHIRAVLAANPMATRTPQPAVRTTLSRPHPSRHWRA